MRASYAIAISIALHLVACRPGDEVLWRPGVERSYAVDLHSTARSGAAPVPMFDLSVNAKLRVVPHAPVEGKQRLDLALSDVKVDAQNRDEHAQRIAQYTEDLQRRYQVELQDDTVTALYVDPASSPMAVAFVRTLASVLQVSRPSTKGASSYEATEYDATGRYVARYERDADELRKHKLRYENVLSVSAAPTGSHLQGKEKTPELTRSALTLALKDGAIASAKLDEAVVVSMLGDTKLSYATKLELALERASEGAKPAGDAGLVRLPVDKPYADTPKLEDLDAARIGNLSFEQVVTQLETIAQDYDPAKLVENPKGDDADTDADLDAEAQAEAQEELAQKAIERNRYFTALAAMYRRDDATIDQAVAKVRGGSPAAGWLVNALGAAGNERSQAVLVELMKDAALPLQVRKSAGVSLMRAAQPSVAAANAVEGLLDDAQWHQYACYGLGTYVRRLREAGQTAASDRFASALLTRLAATDDEQRKVDLLGGLANAAHEPALPVIATYAKADAPRMREAALRATRLLSSPQADALVIDRMANDTEASVRVSALQAAAKRRTPAAPILTATKAAASSDPEPRVRIAALKTLAAWLPSHRELRTTLDQAASSDPSDTVRLMAKAILTRADERELRAAAR